MNRQFLVAVLLYNILLTQVSLSRKTTTTEKPKNDTEYPASETVLLRVFTSAGEFRTIDVKSHDDRLSTTCQPGARSLYKLAVHGFAETWNMSFRWNWVDEMRREILASPVRDHICFIAVDWEGLARGAKLVANYWRAIENMELAGIWMADYFKANELTPKNVHCIGFSLGAHMCGVFYRVYYKKFGVKLGRITGLDPAGPFFKNKPNSDKLHYSQADLVDIIHTSEQFGLSEKNGHMDFYPDSGPSNINACSESMIGRFENENENVILFEEKTTEKSSSSKQQEYENVTFGEKELNKTGGLSGITLGSISTYFGGFYDRIKNVLAKNKPKRIFTKVHQFLGCSHLMAVRFFIYSVNECDYRAVYCHNLDEFKKNKCPRKTLAAYPRMGFAADQADDFYKKSMGNFFLTTYEKPPYCLKSAEPKRNVSEFFRYFLDHIKPPKTKNDLF